MGYSCKGCLDRCVGCHSVCAKYLKEQQEEAIRKSIVQKKRQEESIYYGYYKSLKPRFERIGAKVL